MNVTSRPRFAAELLDGRLEQSGAVGRRERIGVLDSGLERARPGLGVQSFEGNAELGQRIHERMNELGAGGGAEQAIAEHAGRGRRHRVIVFGVGGGGRLLEDEELVLGSHARRVAYRFGAGDDALERLAWAEGQWRAVALVEVGEAESSARLPGDEAQRVGIEASQ